MAEGHTHKNPPIFRTNLIREFEILPRCHDVFQLPRFSRSLQHALPSQQTRDVHPMTVQYWPTVYEAGPALKQPWVNVTKWLGLLIACKFKTVLFTERFDV